MTTDEIFDFGDDYDELTPEQRTEKLGLLSELIDALGDAQDVVKSREEALKTAQHRVKELEESTIPELMEELGMKSFETQQGMKVKLEEKIRVGRVKSPEALQWLEENGHAGVIKTNVGVALPREDREKAKKLAKQLGEMGMDAKVEAFVEWGTAASLLKELRENGDEAPMDLFKASDFKRVKVAR
jgi:hypothetical protein